jgi:hypothetical protein
MAADIYKKLDIEVGMPLNAETPGFLKLDGFVTQSQVLIQDKLKLVCQLQGGIIRPIGSKRTAINDRFFISNAMGYSHLGHDFKSAAHESLQD